MFGYAFCTIRRPVSQGKHEQGECSLASHVKKDASLTGQLIHM